MTTPRLTLLTASLALTLSTISGLAGAHTPDGAVAPGASTWTMMPSITSPSPTSELIARRGRGTEVEPDEGETDDSGADPDLGTTPEPVLAKGRRNDDATVETDDSGADPDRGMAADSLLAKGRRNDDATVETDDSGADPDHGAMSRVLLAKRSCPRGYEDSGPNGECVLEPPEPDEDESGHGGHGGDDGPNHT